MHRAAYRAGLLTPLTAESAEKPTELSDIGAKKVCVLGISSLLGSALMEVLSETYVVDGTTRKELDALKLGEDWGEKLGNVLKGQDIVINCIASREPGVLMKDNAKEAAEDMHFLNVEFPKRVEEITIKNNQIFINISTNYVWNAKIFKTNEDEEYGYEKDEKLPEEITDLSHFLDREHPAEYFDYLELQDKAKSFYNYTKQKSEHILEKAHIFRVPAMYPDAEMLKEMLKEYEWTRKRPPTCTNFLSSTVVNTMKSRTRIEDEEIRFPISNVHAAEDIAELIPTLPRDTQTKTNARLPEKPTNKHVWWLMADEQSYEQSFVVPNPTGEKHRRMLSTLPPRGEGKFDDSLRALSTVVFYNKDLINKLTDNTN